ncbi:MAG: hypothetical protein WEA09_08080 [Gemmatimonadota bacterium]
MGRFDEITPAVLRADLVRFARLLLRLDREGSLLDGSVEIQETLGELRQKLFAWEVRATTRLLPPSPPTPAREYSAGHDPDAMDEPSLMDSLRIVREALEREEELREEWGRPGHSDSTPPSGS